MLASTCLLPPLTAYFEFCTIWLLVSDSFFRRFDGVLVISNQNFFNDYKRVFERVERLIAGSGIRETGFRLCGGGLSPAGRGGQDHLIGTPDNAYKLRLADRLPVGRFCSAPPSSSTARPSKSHRLNRKRRAIDMEPQPEPVQLLPQRYLGRGIATSLPLHPTAYHVRGC